MKSDRHSNRLIREKSPYLLQHAHNPVDWYPWGEEAFEEAKRENKPIFLSIGYSTCHWCHVMEAESFEDEEVASAMNKAFVSIKVDREERPDIDGIYMTVCQLMTGSGGWPLNIIMTPDKKPFFADTYIPKNSRYGKTGMMELAPRVDKLWNSRHGEILESAETVINALKSGNDMRWDEEPREEILKLAFDDLRRNFDEEYGGFGSSPKFPNAQTLLFLLRYWKRTGEKAALHMVEKTLECARNGGIYDHVGFGFHRYSTDREWLVPHFEKMLYDQAMMAMVYVEAYQATGNAAYAKTAREVFTYVLRDMKSPERGFYTAEDADSEGEEGKFYLWAASEIEEILGSDVYSLFSEACGIADDGNFHDEATGRMTGKNILHLTKAIPELSRKSGLEPGKMEAFIGDVMEKLFRARRSRIHPHKDDKQLADWNGLMIAALAKGGRALEETEYLEAATEAADFILEKMRKTNGALLHRYRDGEAVIEGNLDDYAFMIMGLIELYEATMESRHIEAALELNGYMMRHFSDPKGGAFLFTPDDAEKMILRSRDVYDAAYPSGNAVAMMNLLKTARMTGMRELESSAMEIARSIYGLAIRSPSAFSFFLCSLDYAIGPASEIIIVGKRGSDGARKMLAMLDRAFLPNTVTIFLPEDGKSGKIPEFAPFLKTCRTKNGMTTAYVCRNRQCALPTTNAEEMLAMANGATVEKKH